MFCFQDINTGKLTEKIFTVLCVTKIALWHKVICTNMIEDIFIFQKKKNVKTQFVAMQWPTA